MALRTIVQDGDPILKKVCRPVTKFDDRLGTLLDDMKETLLAANGLGLAGPQVGMMRRLFICLDDRDLPEEVPANYEYKFIEFINPEILELSDEQVELYEGCLSFPGHNGAIKRSKHVKVKAQDRHGEWFELEAEGLLAAASSMRTTIWTASPSWTWPSISMRTTTPRKTRTKIYAHPVYGNS